MASASERDRGTEVIVAGKKYVKLEKFNEEGRLERTRLQSKALRPTNSFKVHEGKRAALFSPDLQNI